MGVVDEKDYIMRMIKEMVQVLFSLVFGKKYVSVELVDEVLFGFKQLLEKSGYKDLIRLIGRVDEEER